jgi:hypothetical protein
MSPWTSIRTENRGGYVPHELDAQLLGTRQALNRP